MKLNYDCVIKRRKDFQKSFLLNFFQFNSVVSLSATNQVMSFPFSNFKKLCGHFGEFGQNFSQIPKSENSKDFKTVLKYFWQNSAKPNHDLRFLAVSTPPYVFSDRNVEESTFSVYGPIYSIVAETAAYLNQRYFLLN